MKVSPPFRENGATEFFHKAYRAIALEYYKRITMKTPRDTGRAAGNWQISINQDSWSETSTKLPQKGSFSDSEASKLNKPGQLNFPTITISNALPYIIALEYGHSKQARNPAGMVRVTLSELNGWAARGLK